jgi:hypothetical protein
MPTFSIPRPSKIYPNRDFWFENIPSGNPGHGCFTAKKSGSTGWSPTKRFNEILLRPSYDFFSQQSFVAIHMSKSVDCDLLCKNWAAFLLAAKSWWISSAARCALSRKMNTQKRRKKRVQSMVAKSRCTICPFPNRKSLFGICIFGGHVIENVGIHILW